MKKSNITLFLVFLAVIGFLIYIAYRNEKKPAPEYPDEKINIKEPIEVDTSKYKSDKGK